MLCTLPLYGRKVDLAIFLRGLTLLGAHERSTINRASRRIDRSHSFLLLSSKWRSFLYEFCGRLMTRFRAHKTKWASWHRWGFSTQNLLFASWGHCLPHLLTHTWLGSSGVSLCLVWINTTVILCFRHRVRFQSTVECVIDLLNFLNEVDPLVLAKGSCRRGRKCRLVHLIEGRSPCELLTWPVLMSRGTSGSRRG